MTGARYALCSTLGSDRTHGAATGADRSLCGKPTLRRTPAAPTDVPACVVCRRIAAANGLELDPAMTRRLR